jgi:hypothetical protein
MSATNEESEEGIYDQVWTILVEECGAPDDELSRRSFIHIMLNEPDTMEYRFQGKLGFGGKFWPGGDFYPPHVSCYMEDETDERRAMIRRANSRLRNLTP